MRTGRNFQTKLGRFNSAPGNVKPDPIPGAREIGWVDKQNVCGENIPLKEGDVEGVFQPEMKEQSDCEQAVAEVFHPDQNAQTKFEGDGRPTSPLEHRRAEKPSRHREAPQGIEMIDVVQGSSVQPCRTLYLVAKCSEIKERQLNLNHALRPGPLRFDRRMLSGPAFRFSAPDPQQSVERQCGAGGREHQEESGKAEERVAACGG